MLYRYFLRQSCAQKRLSTAIQNPVFPKNIFLQRNVPTNVLEIPTETYPNPLLSYDKDQLRKLSLREIKHLLQLEKRSENELDHFHRLTVEIFHEDLVKDTLVAVRYLEIIEEPEVREAAFAYLRNIYTKDPLRMSILAFIEDPAAKKCRQLVLANLRRILGESDTPEAKALVALNYMRKLALTQSVNAKTLCLPPDLLESIYLHVPQARWSELYAVLVQTNIKFLKDEQIQAVKRHLLGGSQMDKFIARTGMLDPKWHETETSDFSDAQRQKMANFFLVRELAASTQHYIRQKDVTSANMFLELLVLKFEGLSDTAHTQLVLSVMLSHSMTFKGPQECLKFLKYIRDSKLKVVPGTLLRILTALRIDCFYDEALLLVNFLHTEQLTAQQRQDLVSEIMKVITGKFGEHPKIAIGYFAALFNGEAKTPAVAANNGALQTLKELMLLDLIYGPGSVAGLFSAIEQAEIHEDLQNSHFTHSILRDIYMVTIRSLPAEQSTSPVLISRLYEEYKRKVIEAKTIDNTLWPFRQENMDFSIVAIFLDYLLREDPEARNNMSLVQDRFKFETAKQIFNDFFATCVGQNTCSSLYIFDLMISSALTKHQDLPFAVSAFKRARDLRVPITFNQVFPLIMHHYQSGEMDRAAQWFRLLMISGVKAKSVAAEKLFDIAKEQKWEFTGSMYRNAVRRKAKASREQLKTLTADPGVLGNTQETYSDLGTDLNFGEELEKILHGFALDKKTGKSAKKDKENVMDSTASLQEIVEDFVFEEETEIVN